MYHNITWHNTHNHPKANSHGTLAKPWPKSCGSALSTTWQGQGPDSATGSEMENTWCRDKTQAALGKFVHQKQHGHQSHGWCPLHRTTAPGEISLGHLSNFVQGDSSHDQRQSEVRSGHPEELHHDHPKRSDPPGWWTSVTIMFFCFWSHETSSTKLIPSANMEGGFEYGGSSFFIPNVEVVSTARNPSQVTPLMVGISLVKRSVSWWFTSPILVSLPWVYHYLSLCLYICENTHFRHTDVRWLSVISCRFLHPACRSRCAGKRRMRARPVKMRRTCVDWDGLSTDGCIKQMDDLYGHLLSWNGTVCDEKSMDWWF